MMFLSLAFITFTVLIAVLCWDQWRWQALLGLTVVYALVGVVCFVKARRMVRNAPTLLEGTLAEIEKDYAALRR